MISSRDLAVYEKIIQERYPSAIVIPETRLVDEYDNSICALGIPDEVGGEFEIFVIYELAPAVEALGAEQVAVISYSQEDAEKLYPEACKAIPV